MRILVTGSNGLLGQKLTKILSSQKEHTLIATARGKSILPITNGEYHVMDICNAEEVDGVIKNTRPDVVIHTGAMTNVDQCETDREGCWTANVTAVENVIRACRDAKSRLIHLSTDFIFDGSHGPLDENEEPAPVNYYGESKLAAEKLVMKSMLDWSIVRTVLVYGITKDMSRSNIVLWVKNSLEQGKEIRVVDDQFRTPTLAEDLAMGCYLAATRMAKGVYNISGKDFLSPYEIAIHTARFFDLDETLIHKTDSSQFKQAAKRPLVTGFIIDKARKDLGYEPHSFIEGIKVIAEQIKSPGLA
jgi:dTDP-4-dehydrorhamnose reductase